MERAHRQQSNHEYWEQAQNLRPLWTSPLVRRCWPPKIRLQEAYAEFERSLKEVAKRVTAIRARSWS
jgi:hypothetical protein